MERRRQQKCCCSGRTLMGLVMVTVLGISTYMYLGPQHEIVHFKSNPHVNKGKKNGFFEDKTLIESPHDTLTSTENSGTNAKIQGPTGVIGVEQDPAQKPRNSSTILQQQMTENDDLTVVTAYFNIGKFQKGEGSTFFGPDLYHKWMKIFRFIDNPLAVFVETDEDVNFFRNLRSYLPTEKTKIYKISREETWAFGLLPKIKAIYEKPDYPKHHPNTVVPEYSCAMHAKYEIMHKISIENPFKTKYLCWLDIGLYRHISDTIKETFHMALPPGFDEKKIAYTEVYSRNEKFQHQEIFLKNYVWVCGCFFIGSHDLMAQWTTEYRNYTEKYIAEGIMNTDQQILYSMKNEEKLKTEIQTYIGDRRYDIWFHLGYLCKEEGEKQKKKELNP